jgi:hypothetical protein
MISIDARNGLDHLLTRALKASMAASPEDACEVAVLSDLSEIGGSKMVALTVSSYLFRLMVMIYFTPDQATKAHFARMNKVAAADMSDQSFYDAISECGNICCGIFNRDLGAYFPHIGMSTPNLMDKNCSSYLAALNCGHIQHFRVGVDGVPLFHVSLCACEYADLDFVVDADEEGASTGELELF